MIPSVFAALFAAAVAADPAAHTVSFTATATGVGENEPVEFLFVAPASDRAYEALYVTDATVAELARAFDAAGIPRGKAVDASACRFRPCGPRLSLSPSLDGLLKEKDSPRVSLPLVWTGGRRDVKGEPVGETNMPSSVVALYDCPDSLLTLDDALPQSDVYGRYHPVKALKKGEKATFTVRWDGAPAPAPRKVVFRPGTAAETFRSLKSESGEIDLLADFDPSMTLEEARTVATALALLDSRAVRVNGSVPGRFFYRAFLPLEKWRDRSERLTQPLEIRLDGEGKASYTIVDEDWNVEGTDPKLSARTVDAAAAAAFKGDTVFFFAPAATRLEAFHRLLPSLPKSIRNWYLFPEN